MDIYATVRLDGNIVATISATPYPCRLKGHVNFHLNVTIDKGAEVGTHTRTVRQWPADNFNALYLLQEILSLINCDRAIIEGGIVEGSPPDLARQFGDFMRALPGQAHGQLRDHGPTLWSGQPVEPGHYSYRPAVRTEDRERRITGEGDSHLQFGDGYASAFYD